MNVKLFIQLVLRNDRKTIGDLCRIWLYRVVEKKMSSRPEIFHGGIPVTEVLAFKPAPAPVVTIIVPAYNQWRYTFSCLSSILLNTTGIPYEIILADDVSEDETRNIMSRVSGLRVIRNKKNLGFLRTCNRAAQEAAGKYLLFLNNDTYVQTGWLNSLLETMERDRCVGLVGAKLLFPDGSLQEAGGLVWNDGSCWLYGRGDDANRLEYNVERDADYLSGACLMISDELWKKIQGFDERYAPAYYEDTDLAFTVRGHGYRVVYQPQSMVVHFEGASSGTDERSGIKRYQRTNREKFFRKWEKVLKEGYPEPGALRVNRS